jgi:hypothetical protein
MGTIVELKSQCVEQKGTLLCFIPGKGVIQLKNGKYFISKRENRFAQPLQKDVWHRVIRKKDVTKRDMTTEEIEAAEKAMKERKDVLNALAEKKRIAAMRKRPRMRAGGNRF